MLENVFLQIYMLTVVQVQGLKDLIKPTLSQCLFIMPDWSTMPVPTGMIRL